MVEFNHVSKIYDTKITSVEDISFKVHKGEFVFLIGPSGSGKTTIIKMLIRDEVPTEGKIFFDDIDITRISRKKVYKLRREIGVIFQDFKLVPDKTTYENVAFAMEAAGRTNHEIKETVPYVLDIVGLSNRMKAFPRQLSGGEQQRVAIARAIANNPKILIADEPTGNLDPASSWDIVQVLTKINNWGTTVIMSTHGTDIVNSLNKRVIQMEKGKIIRDDNKGQYEMINTYEKDILDSENHDKKGRSKNKSRKNYNVTLKNQDEEIIAESEIVSKQHRNAFLRFVSKFKRKHDEVENITDILEKPLDEIYSDNRTGEENQNIKGSKIEDIKVEESSPEDNESKSEIENQSEVPEAVNKIDDEKIGKSKSRKGIFFDLNKDIENPHDDTTSSNKVLNVGNIDLQEASDSKALTKKGKKKGKITLSKSTKHDLTWNDANSKELLNRMSNISVDTLDLPKAVIKDLKSAGYNSVDEILEAGVEKLTQNLLIDPEEIILVSKAIKKLVG